MSLGIGLGLTHHQGVPASFSPLDLSPVLWLDATTGLYQDAAKTTPAASDGDVVGAWEDQSGNGNDATQSTTAKKPLLKQSIQNGKDVVRADSTDDLMDFNSLNLGGAFTVVAAYSVSSFKSVSYLLGGSNQGMLVGGSAASIDGYGVFSGGLFREASSEPTAFGLTTWMPANLYRNGAEATYATADTITALTVSRLFTRTDDTSFRFVGDLAELLVFDGALSDTDRQALESYLADRWGITLS